VKGRPRVRTFPLSALGTARDSEAHVVRLADPLPSFVHKWSGAARAYDRAELKLPERIFVDGTPPVDDAPIIAVGGTRSPTVDGFCLVSQVVRLVAEAGCTIVSGGVPGVDLAAHLAALESPVARTYAVLANPVAFGLGGHEWANDALDKLIRRRGAFLSEYDTFAAFGSLENRERLLQRDRIISGISDVFVAFECNVNSATVDTAFRAMAQGKLVIAVAPAQRGPRRGAEALGEYPRVQALKAAELDPRTIAEGILRAAVEARASRRRRADDLTARTFPATLRTPVLR
jgi:hypothetical protein